MNVEIEYASPLAPPLPLRRFTVEQYHQLGELGVLTPEDNVELLEGWIVEKMNQRPIHGYLVGWLSEWFHQYLPAGYIVRCQLPISTQRSEPEPDLAIVAGNHRDYKDRHPTGQECRLIIEVADTSVERDRAKAAIYQAAGVEEYWLVNVGGRCVERYCFTGNNSHQPPVLMAIDSHAILSLPEQELALEVAAIFR